jgi:hypothetical protein
MGVFADSRVPGDRCNHHHRDHVLAVIVFIVLYNGLVKLRNRVDNVVPDRRPAPAPARPDPQPGRDGKAAAHERQTLEAVTQGATTVQAQGPARRARPRTS